MGPTSAGYRPHNGEYSTPKLSVEFAQYSLHAVEQTLPVSAGFFSAALLAPPIAQHVMLPTYREIRF